jgi:uroporphyrinogen-III synthase
MTRVVVVTASAGTFSDLPAMLADLPIVVEEHPLLRFEPPQDWTRLDAALDDLSRFDAVALTSPRAAQAVAQRMRLRKPALARAGGPAVWAVGLATARALAGTLAPVRMPEQALAGGSGAALARAMLEFGCKGTVLFPCGDRRREELPSLLRAGGCEVHEVVCYRSVLAGKAEASAAAARASILVVASPSVMTLLAGSCPPPDRPQLVAIGPTTSASASESGWPPAAVADQPISQQVASAITGLLARQRR